MDERLTCRQEAETSEAPFDAAWAAARLSLPLEGLALLAAKEFAIAPTSGRCTPSEPASEALATCGRGVEASTPRLLLLAALAPRGTLPELRWWWCRRWREGWCSTPSSEDVVTSLLMCRG